jgi:hypothetical protein
MPSDHPHVSGTWWSKHVAGISQFAETYEISHRWGVYVIQRSTGEKVFEPMPLVRHHGDKLTRSMCELACICCLWEGCRMKVIALA